MLVFPCSFVCLFVCFVFFCLFFYITYLIMTKLFFKTSYIFCQLTDSHMKTIKRSRKVKVPQNDTFSPLPIERYHKENVCDCRNFIC